MTFVRRYEMKKTRLIILLFLALFAAKPAHACSVLNALPFGESIAVVANEYNLNKIDTSILGHAIIETRSSNICKGLPEDAEVEFVFIDDNFVQLRITSHESTGEIFPIAESTLGVVVAKPEEPDIKAWNFQYSWSKPGWSAAYSSHPDGGKNMEFLEISSANHQSFFTKLALEDEKME